jgi:CRP-like cAMP-binding protein
LYTQESSRPSLAEIQTHPASARFVSERSVLDGRAHSASTEALEDTRVFVLTKSDMDRLLSEIPQTAYKIVCEMTIAISEILRDMSNKSIKMADYIWE